MSKNSDFTKVCRMKLWLYRILDWLILFAPLIIYVVIALVDGGVTTMGKVSVVGSVAIAAILALFNILAQKRLRCPIWIVLIGLFIAIRDYLLPLIIILAVVTVLDDLVLTPLITYYRSKLIANKSIDERLGQDGDIESKSTTTTEQN